MWVDASRMKFPRISWSSRARKWATATLCHSLSLSLSLSPSRPRRRHSQGSISPGALRSFPCGRPATPRASTHVYTSLLFRLQAVYGPLFSPPRRERGRERVADLRFGKPRVYRAGEENSLGTTANRLRPVHQGPRRLPTFGHSTATTSSIWPHVNACILPLESSEKRERGRESSTIFASPKRFVRFTSQTRVTRDIHELPLARETIILPRCSVANDAVICLLKSSLLNGKVEPENFTRLEEHGPRHS